MKINCKDAWEQVFNKFNLKRINLYDENKQWTERGLIKLTLLSF